MREIRIVFIEEATPMANMSIVGKRNKANGALFEAWISASCDHYSETGIAFMEKTPEPFHITSRGKDGVVSGYYEKSAQPDYKGILKGGKGVMFEAKHTDCGMIKQGAVTETQSRNLDMYHELGAICFVLVSMGFESFHRVPWPVWKGMKEIFGHKHMTLDEIGPYRVKSYIGMIDFLDGIEAMDEKWKHVDGD